MELALAAPDSNEELQKSHVMPQDLLAFCSSLRNLGEWKWAARASLWRCCTSGFFQSKVRSSAGVLEIIAYSINGFAFLL